MPPKEAIASASLKASKSKAKPAFDPFERVCTYTTVPLFKESDVGNEHADAFKVGSGTEATAGNDEHAGSSAEFSASALTITPPLPKTAVSLVLQFRVNVPLLEGDTVYVHLPKFTGAAPQQFGFASTPINAARPTAASPSGATPGSASNGGHHADRVVDTTTHFRGFWSGDAAKVTSAVQQVEFKRGKKGLAPPKQVLLIQCIKEVPADTLLVFYVPRALGLMTPDKLTANSAKLKIEGPEIECAEGRRIMKQVILTSTEIKKRTVVEELALYDHCIAKVAQEGDLNAADRHLSEQLALEEVDQIWQAAQHRGRFPLPMPWTVAQEIGVTYAAAGSFIKRIFQNAIKSVKGFDALAVHKEVARNWGVKPAAVVLFDNFLTTRWGGLYPGVPRISLFAACVLTMEPDDVGRAFLTVDELPARSVAEELISAFRVRVTLDTDPTKAAAAITTTDPAAAANTKEEEEQAKTAMADILQAGGIENCCGQILDKWAALLTALLPASFVADTILEEEEQAMDNYAREMADGMAVSSPPRQQQAQQSLRRRRSSARVAQSEGSGATAALRSPPTLYLGYRDVPYEAQHALRELKPEDWFVLPFHVVAREALPYTAVTPSSLAASTMNAAPPQLFHGGAAAVGEGNVNGFNEHDEESADGAAVMIPDRAVVVELRNVVEALELADVSLSPYNRAWLLPLASSCRVLTVEEDQHDVLHIVVSMEGSLVGQLNDPYLPQTDRSVASMIIGKYLLKIDQIDSHVCSLSLLTALYATRNERRRLHPPTLIRAQYLAHYHAAMLASKAKRNVDDTERVEWQLRTHDAQLLDEGVVKPAVWEPILRKYMVTVEQFFLAHSRAVYKLEEGNLSVDLAAYTIDYGGKGPRALRRVVEKVYVTHEALPPETYAILAVRGEQYGKQLQALDTKLGISPGTEGGKRASAKPGSSAPGKKKKG